MKGVCRSLVGLGILAISGCVLPGIDDLPLPTSVEPARLPPCIDDDCNCGDFRDQPLAQLVLESFPEDPFVLDRDGNGVACEALPPVSAGLEPVTQTSENVHLTLGNPSNASVENSNNFLLERAQYALSYNGDRGMANWVSWHLSANWLGSTERQDNFRQDGGLPAGVYQVTPSDYRNTGFDRGHIVPSGDRTRNPQDNSATFLMTNVLPQVPENNRGVWRELEEYSRDLVDQFDQELFIIAGGYGVQTRLAEGRVTVPSRLWKVIVVLEPGQSLADVDLGTPVIVVDMPNGDMMGTDWRAYQTTVDRLELATGYDLLSLVPVEIQAVLEASIYEIPGRQ